MTDLPTRRRTAQAKWRKLHPDKHAAVQRAARARKRVADAARAAVDSQPHEENN